MTKIDQMLAGQELRLTIDSTRDVQRKLCSVLGPLRAGADATREACHKLIDMAADQRADFIRQTWGPAYYNRAQPMVDQLNMVEIALARLTAANELE